MYYCISYDITSNKLRLQVIKALKISGLYRAQRSVFMGAAALADLRAIEQAFVVAAQPQDRFCIIALDAATWRNMHIVGEPLIGHGQPVPIQQVF